MNNVLFKTLKKKDYLVKNYLIKVVHELELTLNDTLLLIYFMNQETPTLNLENIKENVYLNEEEAMNSFEKLVELDLIEVKTIENEQGVMEEIISCDNILQHATNDIQSDIKKEEKTDIFESLESEFGRTLSSMEFQIVNNWLDKYDESLIHEALKEAVYSNAKSFRYISRILQAWNEKGYKTSKDIKKDNTDDNIEINLFEYDWLDDPNEQ